MTASDFADTLLTALASSPQITTVDLHTEGPIVSGRAGVDAELFLAFYYNQSTATQSFALVKNAKRIWGIDYDLRGWHLHPATNPADHVDIEPQDIPTIIGKLRQVLEKI